MPKIECPKCLTSYQTERLGIKVGPKEKSLLWCKVCGAKLEIRIDEVEKGVRVPGTWRTFWRPKIETQVELVVSVTIHGN